MLGAGGRMSRAFGFGNWAIAAAIVRADLTSGDPRHRNNCRSKGIAEKHARMMCAGSLRHRERRNRGAVPNPCVIEL